MDKLQKIKDKWKYEKYIELEHVDYLIKQAEDNQMLIERVDEIGTLALSREQSYKNLEKNYRACNYFKKQHYDEMIRLQKENKQTMTRVHELASVATDQEQEYKDLQKEKRLAEEECERYKKMFSEEKGKSITLYNQNKRYEQALEFYENKGNYKTVIENDREIKFLGTSLAQMDGGEVARKVLESSGTRVI